MTHRLQLHLLTMSCHSAASGTHALRHQRDESRDDDELLQLATNTIAKWSAASNPPSMTEVQNLLYELICNGGSAMLRDRVVAAIVSTFGDGFGGKRALAKTWGDIARQVAASDLSPRVGLMTVTTTNPLQLSKKLPCGQNCGQSFVSWRKRPT